MSNGKAVLVTGGAGYVGSHTCKALSRAGYTPVAYDNLSEGHTEAVRWGPFEAGDIRDAARLDEVLARHAIAAVLHFAARAHVGESVAEPARYYGNNVVGTLTLLDAMRRRGVRRLVFSSSCATYGIPRHLPIGDDEPQAPVNPYGATKRVIEQVLRDYDAAYGLRSVALRYFNAAGADPEGEIGERHDPETHLIPLAIRAVLDSGFRLPIFGDDYPTPDGTAVRDYVHVSDLADAHVRALAYLEAGNASIALNLGTGRGTSVREVVETVARVAAQPPRVEIAPRRPGDPPELFADATGAARVLGWRPRFALEEMVAHAYGWHLKQYDRRLLAAIRNPVVRSGAGHDLAER